MKKPFYYFLLSALLNACSAAPKMPQPAGDWLPVNKPIVAKAE